MPTSFFAKLGYLILELLAFAVLGIAGVLLLTAPFVVLGWLQPADLGLAPNDPYWSTFTEYVPQNAAFLAAFFVIRKYLFKRPLSEMGLTKTQVLPDLGKGFLYSTLLITAGFLVLLALQKLTILFPVFDFKVFMGLLLLFFFQSLSEEIMSRGFLLATIAHYFGNFWGLLLSSLIFSLLHFFNPDFSWIAGANIFLAGLALGLLFLKYRNLWVCTGFHWGWNFTQSGFFDFNVSGFDVVSYIRFTPLAPAWLSGGTFGFEGSILSVIFLLAFNVYWLRKVDFSPPQPEAVQQPGTDTR